MKSYALYHPYSEHARSVEEFANNIKYRCGQDVSLLSLETTEGSSMSQLYGIVSYPAIVVTTDEGTMQKIWEGPQLPLAGEVISYLIA